MDKIEKSNIEDSSNSTTESIDEVITNVKSFGKNTEKKVWLSTFCKCGNAINNQLATDRIVVCPKCKAEIKC